MEKFNKRIYKGFGDFLADVSFVMQNRKRINLIQKGEVISPDFRQRLMMAVTVVNGCRYCTYVHSRIALKSGISPEELALLLKGVVENCPEDEVTALLYAQHWAEANGKPDPEFRQKLIETYGTELAENIDLTLRTIRFGNLSGNSFDYILYKMSWGRFGLPQKQG